MSAADFFQATIADFGKRLGIAGLRAGTRGAVELRVERVGTLQMELAGDAVCVALTRAWPPHGEKVASALLRACHWRENHPWPIHPGGKKDAFMALVAVVPASQFDVPAVEKIIGYLSAMLDDVEKAA